MSKPPLLPLLLWASLYAADSQALTGDPSGQLSYTISYQGVLSLGMPLDIAAAELYLSPQGEEAQQIQLSVSTEEYGLAEAVMPSRFCYLSRLDASDLATLEADWRSRIGTKAAHGRLRFDQAGRRVLRLEAEHKLKERRGKESVASELVESAMRPAAPIDSGQAEVPFPPGTAPLDRLGMVLWLRQQPLAPGRVLRPTVSNGKHLVGYSVEVEGIETIEWNGGQRRSFRIRLEPRVNDDSDTPPTWLWLSQDQDRLPLLLRSSRTFGSFEARLLPQTREAARECDIPETADLVLPTRPR